MPDVSNYSRRDAPQAALDTARKVMDQAMEREHIDIDIDAAYAIADAILSSVVPFVAEWEATK